MKLSDVTALGRTLDPRYPTNLGIALLSAMVTLAATVARLSGGMHITESISWGLSAGISVFFAWALSRELDPDCEMSAFAGAGLATLALLFFDTSLLMVVLWLILALRMVNRTVGLPARPLDTLAGMGLGTWLTWQDQWLAGLLTALAFLFDGLLSPPLRYHLALSLFALVATVGIFIFQGSVATASGPTTSAVICSVAMAGLFLVVIATSRKLQAVGDATGKPLNPRRVQAGQILALLTALGFAWRDGVSGMMAMMSLWAAMTGVGIFRLFVLVSLLRR